MLTRATQFLTVCTCLSVPASLSASVTHSPPTLLAALLSISQPHMSTVPFAITWLAISWFQNHAAKCTAAAAYASFSIKAIKAAQCVAPTHLSANLPPVTTFQTRSSTTPRPSRRKRTVAPAPMIGVTENSGGASASAASRRSTRISNRSREISRAATCRANTLPIRIPRSPDPTEEFTLLELLELQPLPPLPAPTASSDTSPSWFPIRGSLMRLVDLESSVANALCGHVFHKECITPWIKNRQGGVNE